jgi:glutamate synthase (ferredoxin)
VSVKLVSEVGIGTVASGVAKAGADIIQVAGHDGGTGASPASSIKFAGSPWELGLVETHATLLRNGLRERVLLRVDGGLKSGWDVVMAAAMGAEEFGFGTIALIAEGCIMARICHTNKCPVGVTTQNEALRKRFPGTPDNVVTYFGYVAEEVRHILATLGFATLDEMIGQPGVLESRVDSLNLKKTSSLDASYIMTALDCVPIIEQDGCLIYDRSWLNHGEIHDNGYTLDDRVLEDTGVQAAIAGHGQASLSLRIKNTDRSAFARVSGAIASKYSDYGFKGSLKFDLTGGAGQSFCAFNGQGMDVTLRGYANDYVCKGMAGGKVVVSPPSEDDEAAKRSGRRNSAALHNVVGNTVLYGATGGSLLVRGRGGERFAVRNSGALGVVEGLGDHGCEYMTAGNIICLGSTGRNFAAGMTGGLAFVIDDEAWLDGNAGSVPEHLEFPKLVNTESVSVVRLGKEYR